MSSGAKVSYGLKRFAGVKRDYTPEEVERLRGSIKIEYSMCKQQSTKLWELLNTEPYINTLGSLFKRSQSFFDCCLHIEYSIFIEPRNLSTSSGV